MPRRATLFALALAPAAHAQEFRLSISAHNTGILGDQVTAGREGGKDIGLELSSSNEGIHLFGLLSFNTARETDFAAMGLEYRTGSRWFIAPGVGIAIHDGHLDGPNGTLKLGSRELFYARMSAGYDFGSSSIALRIEHLSNGGRGRSNNGLDNCGLVFARRF